MSNMSQGNLSYYYHCSSISCDYRVNKMQNITHIVAKVISQIHYINECISFSSISVSKFRDIPIYFEARPEAATGGVL